MATVHSPSSRPPSRRATPAPTSPPHASRHTHAILPTVTSPSRSEQLLRSTLVKHESSRQVHMPGHQRRHSNATTTTAPYTHAWSGGAPQYEHESDKVLREKLNKALKRSSLPHPQHSHSSPTPAAATFTAPDTSSNSGSGSSGGSSSNIFGWFWNEGSSSRPSTPSRPRLSRSRTANSHPLSPTGAAQVIPPAPLLGWTPSTDDSCSEHSLGEADAEDDENDSSLDSREREAPLQFNIRRDGKPKPMLNGLGRAATLNMKHLSEWGRDEMVSPSRSPRIPTSSKSGSSHTQSPTRSTFLHSQYQLHSTIGRPTTPKTPRTPSHAHSPLPPAGPGTPNSAALSTPRGRKFASPSPISIVTSPTHQHHQSYNHVQRLQMMVESDDSSSSLDADMQDDSNHYSSSPSPAQSPLPTPPSPTPHSQNPYHHPGHRFNVRQASQQCALIPGYVSFAAVEGLGEPPASAHPSICSEDEDDDKHGDGKAWIRSPWGWAGKVLGRS